MRNHSLRELVFLMLALPDGRSSGRVVGTDTLCFLDFTFLLAANNPEMYVVAFATLASDGSSTAFLHFRQAAPRFVGLREGNHGHLPALMVLLRTDERFQLRFEPGARIITARRQKRTAGTSKNPIQNEEILAHA